LGNPGEVPSAELLTRAYRHDIDVIRHPDTGRSIVVPRR